MKEENKEKRKTLEILIKIWYNMLVNKNWRWKDGYNYR
jgi:hypothetical protein